LEGDSGEEVALWLLISICAKREVEVALIAAIKPQINEMKKYQRYFPRVWICSTVFIFVTVSITSLYQGGLKIGNIVVKIYRCFTCKLCNTNISVTAGALYDVK
jgi:hypothetical protein